MGEQRVSIVTGAGSGIGRATALRLARDGEHVLLVGLLMGAIPLGLGLWAEATDRPWQTMVFVSLALLQLGHAMAVRSEQDSLWSQGLGSNKPLLWAV